MKENRKSEIYGKKGKKIEKKACWWGNPKRRYRLENPDVGFDDKTTLKMDLTNDVRECGLNSSASEANGGPMSAAEWK